jgi:hypothetical protein
MMHLMESVLKIWNYKERIQMESINKQRAKVDTHQWDSHKMPTKAREDGFSIS